MRCTRRNGSRRHRPFQQPSLIRRSSECASANRRAASLSRQVAPRGGVVPQRGRKNPGELQVPFSSGAASQAPPGFVSRSTGRCRATRSMTGSARPDEILPPAREMRCALLDDKRGKEFQSRVPPAEQATPQYPCSIAHYEFVSGWKFSGLDDGKCLGQCDLFLRPLRIQC